MRFSEFRKEHGGKDRGLHQAVGKTLRTFRTDAVEQGLFPKYVENDENAQYQWIFEKIDKAVETHGGFKKKIVKDERREPSKFFNLVQNWIDKSPEARTVKRPSSHSETEPLMVYYYFSHLYQDRDGTPNNFYGGFIEENLEDTGEVDKKRKRLNTKKRPFQKSEPFSETRAANPKLHIPKEITNDEAWLNPNNFTAIPLFQRDSELELLDNFLGGTNYFSILPVIAPSGAGKTRLITQWLHTQVDLKDWHAGFLRDTDVDPWLKWKPEKDTLIIVDYIFQFSDIIREITKTATEQIDVKIRLILIDHIFPDNFEDIPQQITLAAFAEDGNELDERKQHFYPDGPLLLSQLDNRKPLLLDVIAHVSGFLHTDDRAERALVELEMMGDAALHPLFAALIGYAIKQPDFEMTEQPNRRQLIKYYFDKKKRLPWLDETLPFGKWIGMFVSVSTARRSIPFDALVEFLPSDSDKIRSALLPIFEQCNRIISSDHDEWLRPFEPDIMGETFFLMFLSEFTYDTSGEFWGVFCSMIDVVGPNERIYTRPFRNFMQNLLRNLNNDDQSDPYIQRFWKSLTVFLDLTHFKLDTEFRIAMSEVLIDVVECDNCPENLRDSVLEIRHLNNVLAICERYPLEGFYHLCRIIEVHASDIPLRGPIMSALDDTIELIEEHGFNCNQLLSLTISRKHTIVFLYLLRKSDIDPNWQSKTGINGLLAAIISNNIEALHYLIQEPGLDPNLQDYKGNTPLVYCVALNRVNALKLILYGFENINPNLPNAYDETPLVMACKYAFGDTALELTQWPLVNPNVKNAAGNTALSYACIENLHEVVILLLSRDDVVIESKNKTGTTAFMLACNFGQVQILKTMLLCNSTDVPYFFDINQSNNYGSTALHLACEHGHQDIAKILMSQKEINLDIRDSASRTAADVARIQGNSVICELFENYTNN